MSKLVDMALGQRIQPRIFDLNAKPLNFLDVDERPPPTHKCLTPCSMSATFVMDNSLEFTPTNVMKVQTMSEKLNKIYVAKSKSQHQ